jgi:hypothetical protein
MMSLVASLPRNPASSSSTGAIFASGNLGKNRSSHLRSRLMNVLLQRNSHPVLFSGNGGNIRHREHFRYSVSHRNA